MFPRYPIFIPSKGRAKTPYTIKMLQESEVPFRVVVVPEEAEAYLELVDSSQILVLPRSDLRLVGTRLWIRALAEQEGWGRHWQLDDNITHIYRMWRGHRIPCDAGPAMRQLEDFSDRYTNVGITGMNYEMFGLPNLPPYYLNTHVYSITLVNHAMPCTWRLLYNDDTDLCLQALASGWATVASNVFLAKKITTMKLKGGNTDDLYQGDGRMVMARTLEQMWPGVVTVVRRFQRAQHMIDWRKLKQPLIPKPGYDPEGLPDSDEYGLQLQQVRDFKREGRLKAMVSG